jgi:hypothetical protein
MTGPDLMTSIGAMPAEQPKGTLVVLDVPSRPLAEREIERCCAPRPCRVLEPSRWLASCGTCTSSGRATGAMTRGPAASGMVAPSRTAVLLTCSFFLCT